VKDERLAAEVSLRTRAGRAAARFIPTASMYILEV